MEVLKELNSYNLPLAHELDMKRDPYLTNKICSNTFICRKLVR